jgi:hypothetical protein
MSDFLETLKLRFADAQQRLQISQQNLQRVQHEHAQITAEFSSWQNAVAVETRKEQQAAAAQSVAMNRIVAAAINATAAPLALSSASVPATPCQTRSEDPEMNKTTLIREVLRQHPNGVTPVDVWKEVKDRVARPYVYSVLKRMKDKKQVAVRRGKYFLAVVLKSEESKDHSLTVQ